MPCRGQQVQQLVFSLDSNGVSDDAFAAAHFYAVVILLSRKSPSMQLQSMTNRSNVLLVSYSAYISLSKSSSGRSTSDLALIEQLCCARNED